MLLNFCDAILMALSQLDEWVILNKSVKAKDAKEGSHIFNAGDKVQIASVRENVGTVRFNKFVCGYF